MTGSQLRTLLGDTIPFTYKVNGVPFSGSFTYQDTINFSNYVSSMGFNVSDNSVFGANILNNYDGVYYWFETPYTEQTYFTDIDIQINMDFFGGARGGFMLGQSWSISGIQNAGNSVAVGGNYCGNFPIITGNTQADSSLANYYGVVAMNSSNVYLRPLAYDGTNFSIHHVYYNSIATRALVAGKRFLLLYVVAPYTYGNYDVSVTDPVVTTTTTVPNNSNNADIVSGLDELNTGMNELNTGVSELNSGMNELNTGVSELHSDVLDVGSNIVSALLVPDETLASMNLEPLDTLPDLNYNQVIDDADDVLEDIPSGIVGAASIWAMLDLLFGVDSAFIWIIPLAIFMCVACWVIWRK